MNNFLTFTKGERVAIIVLAAVILLIIAANFFIANYPPNVNKHSHNLDSIIALHEKAVEEYYNSQRSTKNRQQTSSTENKVAMSQSNKDTELQSRKETRTEKKVQKPIVNSLCSIAHSPMPIDINSADTTELKSLPGIGSFFARNIVEYREKLGGFVEKKQLLEVYAFDSTRMSNIENLIVINSIELRKIKVNSDDFKTILRHPYIEYEDVKKIINYRESKGMIKNWETYLKVVGREDVDDRLERYLEF